LESARQQLEQRQEHLTKGDVVIIPTKQVPNDDPKPNRRYLILWEAGCEKYAVCPITTKSHHQDSVALECRDFLNPRALTYDPSYARLNLVFTLERKDDWRKVGTLQEEKIAKLVERSKEILDRPRSEAPKPKALARPIPKPRIR